MGAVVRASVPKMLLDDVFEQKNEVALAVASELEKVIGSTFRFRSVNTLHLPNRQSVFVPFPPSLPFL